MGRGARRHAGERPLYDLSVREQLLQPARHPPVRGRLLRFFNHRRNYTYILGGSQARKHDFLQKSFRGAPADAAERPGYGGYEAAVRD